ncbi:FecR family protein [Anditalea andensis]|uniref:FecR family protein n=1 Tax=Anditalea andensis TaxID=1048983 RepID=A0A074KPJ6_9BACT|nr:FecR domain-containing protein [Anditalea andensis]KEO71881.1 hypothetical protein EL17_20385 [Anditalea andensis]
MEEDQRIQLLISRALTGKLSADEWKVLNDWYQHQKEEYLVIKDYRDRSKSQIKRDILHRIETSVETKQKTKLYYYAAAAASLFLIFSYWIYPPLSEAKKNDTLIYQKVENGVGMIKKIKLPDGSLVFLYHNSSIQFDARFKDDRRVLLSGKAFFDVKKDSIHAFTVITPSFSTEVLGTSFLVNEADSQVAVKTGKVKVENSLGREVFLSPDHLLTYSGDDVKVESILEPEIYFGWVEGQLYFKNTSMPALISELENWYGVTITSNVKDDINCQVTGTYTDLSLESLLQAIQYSIPLTYTINEKNVIIHFKNCN